MYVKTEIRAGKIYQVYKYFSARYGKRGTLPAARQGTYTEAQKRINSLRAERNLSWLLAANFEDGEDGFVSLGYLSAEKARYQGKKSAPDTEAEVQEDLRKLLRILRREYRKNGWKLKYVYTIETGRRGGRHVHIVLNHFKEFGGSFALRKLWAGGVVNGESLYSGGDYTELASYMTKKAGEQVPGEKLYVPSRGLTKPKIKKTVVNAATFSEKVRDTLASLPGFFLDRSSVRCGTHEETGRAYMEYRYVKRDDVPERKRHGFESDVRHVQVLRAGPHYTRGAGEHRRSARPDRDRGVRV